MFILIQFVIIILLIFVIIFVAGIKKLSYPVLRF